MLTKENSGDGAGVLSAGSASRKNGTNGHCNICGQQLLQVCFPRQCQIAHICDNISCGLFSSPQFYTALPPAPAPEAKRTPPAYRSPERVRYLTEKKENYRLLRSLGIPSAEAARMTSRRQTDYYLKSIGYYNGDKEKGDTWLKE